MRNSSPECNVAGARHRREEDGGRQDGKDRHGVVRLGARAEPGVQEALTQGSAQISLPVSRQKIHSELMMLLLRAALRVLFPRKIVIIIDHMRTVCRDWSTKKGKICRGM